eukprot:TCONS_00052781-protein
MKNVFASLLQIFVFIQSLVTCIVLASPLTIDLNTNTTTLESIQPSSSSIMMISSSIVANNSSMNGTASGGGKTDEELARMASLYVAVGFIPGMIMLAVICRYLPDYMYKWCSDM